MFAPKEITQEIASIILTGGANLVVYEIGNFFKNDNFDNNSNIIQ